jgi:hypothetical protein
VADQADRGDAEQRSAAVRFVREVLAVLKGLVAGTEGVDADERVHSLCP